MFWRGSRHFGTVRVVVGTLTRQLVLGGTHRSGRGLQGVERRDEGRGERVVVGWEKEKEKEREEGENKGQGQGKKEKGKRGEGVG